jgi:hypothetical protein
MVADLQLNLDQTQLTWHAHTDGATPDKFALTLTLIAYHRRGGQDLRVRGTPSLREQDQFICTSEINHVPTLI